jgi:hypothetical protein
VVVVFERVGVPTDETVEGGALLLIFNPVRFGTEGVPLKRIDEPIGRVGVDVDVFGTVGRGFFIGVVATDGLLLTKVDCLPIGVDCIGFIDDFIADWDG